MKYPKEQFEVMKEVIKKLSPLVDVRSIHPCALHFVIYQQLSEGQTHNWLYCVPGGTLAKAHKLESLEGCEKLIQIEYPFELYPNNTVDNNIETAVKKALKELGL